MSEPATLPKPPHVVGKLGGDGEWHVLLIVPQDPDIFDGETICRKLTPDQAERLARQLLEYSALVRDKLGLPGGAPFPCGG